MGKGRYCPHQRKNILKNLGDDGDCHVDLFFFLRLLLVIKCLFFYARKTTATSIICVRINSNKVIDWLIKVPLIKIRFEITLKRIFVCETNHIKDSSNNGPLKFAVTRFERRKNRRLIFADVLGRHSVEEMSGKFVIPIPFRRGNLAIWLRKSCIWMINT